MVRNQWNIQRKARERDWFFTEERLKTIYAVNAGTKGRNPDPREHVKVAGKACSGTDVPQTGKEYRLNSDRHFLPKAGSSKQGKLPHRGICQCRRMSSGTVLRVSSLSTKSISSQAVSGNSAGFGGIRIRIALSSQSPLPAGYQIKGQQSPWGEFIMPPTANAFPLSVTTRR